MSGDVARVHRIVPDDGDVVRVAGDLLAGGDLQTAVLVSLFCDAPAQPGDVLPDGATDRGGWWAEAIGSRLWLLKRANRVPSTLSRAEQYSREALQWLIDDLVLVAVTVVAEWLGAGLVLNVNLEAPTGDVTPYRYGYAL